MGIDVFVRTMTGERQNSLRRAFYRATVERWEMEDVRLLFFDMDIREGRIWAEKTAESDPYIFTDDDVLPWGKNWLKRGLWAMEMNPEFVVCSSRSVIAEERGNYEIPQGVEIMEVPAVGAPMWIRKGYLGDLPDFLFVEECIVIHNHVRLKGMKSGIIAGLEHLHLGFGFATNPGLVRGY